MQTNALYYGDNFKILRDDIPAESVDLVYLDPPFNSNRDYNVIFKDESGQQADAQIVAFEDTWHWGLSAEDKLSYLTATHRHHGSVPDTVSSIIDALVSGMGKNQMTAYVVEMTARLVLLRRVLKPTGSLYLHCDPTASHYLKVVLDGIFGPDKFRSEISWTRHSAHNNATRNFGNVRDTILYYVRGDAAKFKTLYAPYSPEYIRKFFRFTNEHGRRYRVNSLKNPSYRPNLKYPYKGFPPPETGWTCEPGRMAEYDRQGRLEFPKSPDGRIGLRYFLDDMKGTPITNDWDDIGPLAGAHAERLGYPTQKPLALLERIIHASTDPGDVVLDAFCGCGTAVVAAHKLGRRWMGIDVTWLAIGVMRRRLEASFGLTNVDVVHRPTEIAWAREAVTTPEGRYEFQWWALDLVGAMPLGGVRKKGADRGIDGVITFPDRMGKMATVVVSVKGGTRIGSGDVVNLRGVIEREKAAVGLFVTLDAPTRDMRREADEAGFWTDARNRQYPKLQILTVDELFNQGRAPLLPTYVVPPYARAARVAVAVGVEQHTLFDGDGQPVENSSQEPIVRRPEDSAPSESSKQGRTRRKRSATG